MPEIFENDEPNVKVKVWKIEEDASFFLNHLQLSKNQFLEYSCIKHEAKKLEWLASRFLLKQLILDIEITKKGSGKPILEQNIGHISLSHCKGFAAAMYSKTQPVGIDIEPIHEKVHRIAQRFLSPNEIAFIDEKQATKHLIACWSIKESIFKMAGEEGINFDEEISITPFKYNSINIVEATLKKGNKLYYSKMRLKEIENCILAYTI